MCSISREDKAAPMGGGRCQLGVWHGAHLPTQTPTHSPSHILTLKHADLRYGAFMRIYAALSTRKREEARHKCHLSRPCRNKVAKLQTRVTDVLIA